MSALTAAFIISNLIFLLIIKAFKQKTGQCQRHVKGTDKILPVLLFLYCTIFFMSGLFCSARLTDYNSNNSDKKFDEILSKNGGASIEVAGRISSHVTRSRYSCSFKIDTAKILFSDNPALSSLIICNAGEFNAVVRNYYGNALERDDLIKFKGSYRCKDYSSYFLTYGHSIEKKENYPIDKWPYLIRKAIYKCVRNTIYNNLAYSHAAICEAAVLGNSANITDSQAKDFINSGIYHLLAISGLHVSFFVVILSSIFLRATKGFGHLRGKINKILGNLGIIVILATLALYNFVIGEKASVLRATIMAVFILFSSRWKKALDNKAALSFSYIILLIINPGFFKNASFWLSFLSVAAILYLNNIISGFFRFLAGRIFIIFKMPALSMRFAGKSKPGYFGSLFVTSLSVYIFIFPVLMYLFGSAGIFAVIINMAAIPVFYALLFILIISSLLAILWPPLGSLLLKPSAVPLFILDKISGLWKISGYSVLRIDDFSMIYVILYYTVLVLSAIVISGFLKKQKKYICSAGG
ncbi:MAG: ComEC family competence protein [Actinobacteria bacterium ADurb.Bin346]|nr:MAG: ComEC family competence protein [Actinobacteria bacterium ADurb.Bin346]